jgi:hypothetical protein
MVKHRDVHIETLSRHFPIFPAPAFSLIVLGAAPRPPTIPSTKLYLFMGILSWTQNVIACIMLWRSQSRRSTGRLDACQRGRHYLLSCSDAGAANHMTYNYAAGIAFKETNILGSHSQHYVR